jgi:hypothetical protein
MAQSFASVRGIGQGQHRAEQHLSRMWDRSNLALRERNWQRALSLAGLAILFLAYLVFIPSSRAAIAVAPVLLALFGWRRFGWKGVMTACITVPVLAIALWATSPNLREFSSMSVQQIWAYSTTTDNSIGEHIEFLRKSLSFVRDAPIVGHGTGSIADLFRRSASGQTGAAGIATVNPHSQIFGVAIQLGLAGVAVLLAMWTAHYLLVCTASWIAWAGTVVVVENIVSSLAHSHLFDFMHGWLYVFGVGVVGGMVLRRSPACSAEPGASDCRDQSGGKAPGHSKIAL